MSADVLYEFSFYPFHIRPGIKPSYVCTTERELMELFLRQHGFDVQSANVEVTTDMENVGYSNIDELKMFRFGSRKRDGIYSIATTECLVADAVTEAGHDLEQTLTFGSVALRNDIEIFDRIQKLVSTLDYAYILDAMAADAQSVDDMYDKRDYQTRYGEYPYYESIALNIDSSFLFDALIDDIVPESKIMPITIESYVSWFTRLIIGKG